MRIGREVHVNNCDKFSVFVGKQPIPVAVRSKASFYGLSLPIIAVKNLSGRGGRGVLGRGGCLSLEKVVMLSGVFNGTIVLPVVVCLSVIS